MRWTRIRDDQLTGCKVYRSGAFTVLVADSETREYKISQRLHLSISHPHRYPDWDTIADARYALLPDDAQMVMYLPPRSEYVNIHRNCFHLHECKCSVEVSSEKAAGQ